MLIRTMLLGNTDDFPYIPDSRLYSEDSVWFDIETTGLSAKTSYIYMIGALKIISSEYYLTQWISEKYTDEADILRSFNEYLGASQTIIHYNGATFDIPFVTAKCTAHGLPSPISSLTSIDIYKIIRPFKDFLHIPDLKQKSLEKWCGVHREDCYSGGELIPVFKNYLARLNFEKLHGCSEVPYKIRPGISTGLPSIPEDTSDDCLRLLMLHNQEDVSGMLHIAGLLSLVDVFQGAFLIIETAVTAETVSFTLQPEVSIPALFSHLNYTDEVVSMFIDKENRLVLTINILNTELKYFYSNYKDYYYLTLEDTAIHKSVADFVDGAYRTAARASNCYTKRQSSFLPSFGLTELPTLRAAYKEKQQYIELNDAFLKNPEILKRYICLVLFKII